MKQRTLVLMARAAVAMACTTACNVEAVGRDTGGIALDGGADAGDRSPRGVIVVNTDYSGASVVSLLSRSGDVASASFIGSHSAAPGLSAAFSGDVVPPTVAVPGDELVLIDRRTSVISWVNLETAEVRAQLSVRTGFLANPHDYAPYSASKAFVTRYEPNLDSGKEPFDSGNDVLIVDPGAPAITGSIDVTPAMDGAEGEYFPRADQAMVAGGKLRVTLNAFNADFTRAVDSRVVTIDPESDGITQVVVTSGLRGCSGLSLAPGGERLAVACTGKFGQDPELGFPDSGVVVFQVGDDLTEIARFTAQGWGTEQVTSAEWTSPSTLLVSTAGRFADVLVKDALRFLDVDSGVLRAEPVLQSEKDAFVLGGAQCDVPARACFVADAETDRGVVRRLSIEDDGSVTADRTIKIDTGTGLPPRYLGRF